MINKKLINKNTMTEKYSKDEKLKYYAGHGCETDERINEIWESHKAANPGYSIIKRTTPMNGTLLGKTYRCKGFYLNNDYSDRELIYFYRIWGSSGNDNNGGFDIKNNFGLIALAIVAIIVLIFAFKK